MDLDDLEVEGYDFCPGCGDWVIAGKKMCGDCARALAEAADEVIALDVDGTKVLMTPPRRPKPKRYESSKIKTSAHRARAEVTAPARAQAAGASGRRRRRREVVGSKNARR